jgi:hypothetical protein
MDKEVEDIVMIEGKGTRKRSGGDCIYHLPTVWI